MLDAVASLPVTWVELAEYEPLLDELRDVIRDPVDVPLVAVATLLSATIVTGDKAFHPLKRPVVKTLKPRDAIDQIEGHPR